MLKLFTDEQIILFAETLADQLWKHISEDILLEDYERDRLPLLKYLADRFADKLGKSLRG